MILFYSDFIGDDRNSAAPYHVPCRSDLLEARCRRQRQAEVTESTPDKSTILRPSRMRYAVLAVFCSLAFIAYVDRISIMRVQEDIAVDLNLARLTAEDEAKLQAEGKQDDPKARKKLIAEHSSLPLSWIFGAFTVGYLLFEIPGGRMGDRKGPRIVLFRIILYWSLFTALTGATDRIVGWFLSSPGPWILVAALVLVRFLFGAGEAGAFPNISRVMARWFPYRDRSFAQGSIWMASRIGGALAPTIVGLLITVAGGWRQSFYLLGAIGAVWALFFFWWFRDRPEDMPSCNQAEVDLIRSGAPPGSLHEDRHSAVPWSRLLTSSNLWALYFCHAFVCFSWFFFTTFISKYFKQQFQIDFSNSEIRSGLPLLAGGVTCLIGGRFSDWLIRRTGNRRWGRSGVGAASLAVAAVLTAMVPHAGGMNMTVVLLCLASAAQDFMVPVMWSLPADIGGKHAGTVAGAMNMAGGVGGIIGTLATARVGDSFGWGVVPWMFAVSYLLAAILWLRIDATEPFDRADAASTA